MNFGFFFVPRDLFLPRRGSAVCGGRPLAHSSRWGLEKSVSAHRIATHYLIAALGTKSNTVAAADARTHCAVWTDSKGFSFCKYEYEFKRGFTFCLNSSGSRLCYVIRGKENVLPVFR